jgi:hypothetical protein
MLSLAFGDPRLPQGFWNKSLVAPSGCWIWTGTRSTSGHGQYVRPGIWYAHRAAYVYLVGPIADGLEIDHLCRVRRCVNPLHLQPVVRLVNYHRGIAPGAITTRTNKCKRGHDLSDAYIVPSTGGRRCRPCIVARSKVYTERNRLKRKAAQ